MAIFKRKKKTPERLAISEIMTLKQQIADAKMPALVEKIAQKEVTRMAKMNSSAPEYTISFNYIDYLVTLPWNYITEDNLDIKRAEAILNQAHFGLNDIKERILEHLAVRRLRLTRKNRILVVDDEQVTRINLEHVFVKEGYEVASAEDGIEALTILQKEHFDVLVTDLKMKRMDGMTLLEKAKALDPAIVVIVITGYASVPTAIDAMTKGSYYFIAKPLRLDEIRTVIRTALGGKMVQLEPKGPALCFIGPPGTGKTSLGLSIAKSLERKFIRISFAGMKDEAEIRGHRRSYVGALPGRIIQEIRRAESCNPVFMLDEIDKIGQNFKGDPAAALLELLDPEQNHQFSDHYLDVPFDLSRIMFIATANTIDSIPGPLLDRLEILNLTSYSEEEKERIAFDYLIPKEVMEAAILDKCPIFTKEAVRKIIREYTREAGLRGLQRKIAAICRKIARIRVNQGHRTEKVVTISAEDIEAFLGPKTFYFEVAHSKDRIGIATGLAWTPTGGEIIFIEAIAMPGRNQLILTGSLGDVMRESAQAALSYLRSNIAKFQITDTNFSEQDIHIHVPSGAIPKDGPSAGLAIFAALLSLFTGRPCRREIALTGELTLSGRVLPVGGIKEKIFAAHRAGVRKVILSVQNRTNLMDLPDEIERDLKLVAVEDLAQISHLVLL
jgi:ATP-dependent Lon protease